MTELSRRRFLEAAGAFAAIGAPAPHVAACKQSRSVARAVRGRAGAAGVVRSADALGAADAGRERSGPIRSAVLARLLPPAARRCRHAQRRRHRRLLPHRGPAAPSQRMARRRAIRSATLVAGCRALGMRVVARTDPHAARDDVQAAHPDWIAVDRRRRSRGGTGRTPTCGSPARSVRTTSSSWTRSIARSSRSTSVDGIFSNRWAPQGGDCYCVHCQRELPRGDRPRPAAHDRPARSRRGAQFIEWRKARLDRALEALGRDRARRESGGAVHPERAAGSEDRRRAGARSSSPTTRRAAA